MKKIMISIAACIIAAGTAFAQVNVGAGYSGTSINPSEGDNSWYNGFNLSVGYNLPLGGGFEFCPSIEYNYLHRSAENTVAVGGVSASSDVKYNEHYLNVPLMFNYGYSLGSDTRIFVFAGPTASFGLYADCKTKLSSSIGGSSASSAGKTVELWGDDTDYKRCDVKIGGGVGLDFCRNWRVTAGYDYGLVNRSKTDGFDLHHHGIHAGLTYIF